MIWLTTRRVAIWTACYEAALTTIALHFNDAVENISEIDDQKRVDVIQHSRDESSWRYEGLVFPTPSLYKWYDIGRVFATARAYACLHEYDTAHVTHTHTPPRTHSHTDTPTHTYTYTHTNTHTRRHTDIRT